MGQVGQVQRDSRAREVAETLIASGVRTVALTFVDNAGITRAKAVPLNRLDHAAVWGVGMSPVFDVFLVDDSTTSGRHCGGPTGDLRLYPDLERVSVLAGQPGWAWAPVDRFTQDGQAYPGCQRTFARRSVELARERGLRLRMAFEVEWFVGTREGAPACHGPAYGMTRIVELASYIDSLLAALDEQGVPVDQFHPEYAPGQMELSVAADDPVAAADRLILVRQTIRAVSLSHGYEVSFAPVVVAGQVGNGQHLHLSAWSKGRNLFSGGDGPYGLTSQGEAVLAGLLDRLPALTAIGAPSVASHLRLIPQRWAAPYQCWGRENRECALRLVTGSVGERDTAANAELKCCDGSANPYLLVGAVTAIATAALETEGRLPAEVTVDPASLPEGRQPPRLPAEVTVDPASLPEGRQPPRLPRSVAAALEALLADDVLPQALGEPLLDAFCAVRRAEAELFRGMDPKAIAEASRWRY